jgi:hypothetical protein
MSGTITRIYGKAEHAEAAIQKLKSAGFADDSITWSKVVGSGARPAGAPHHDQWSVSVRAPFGSGQAATEALDAFGPIGAVGHETNDLSLLSGHTSPGAISRLSGPVFSGPISELSKRKSPGSISKLSGPTSSGAISRLSGRVSAGSISRLSGRKSPGAISRLSGPVSPGSISGFSRSR